MAGARGILVNITAGLNLTIGEFDEVGNTVRDFADEDATVIVGTVVEPDMEDEIRVTVVATGLGGAVEASKLKPKSEEPTVRLVNKEVADEVPELALQDSYKDLERPAIHRRKDSASSLAEKPKESDIEWLDIPAFLRRQAD